MDTTGRKDEMVSVRFSGEVLEALDSIAAKDHSSRSRTIRVAVLALFAKKNSGKGAKKA